MTRSDQNIGNTDVPDVWLHLILLKSRQETGANIYLLRQFSNRAVGKFLLLTEVNDMNLTDTPVPIDMTRLSPVAMAPVPDLVTVNDIRELDDGELLSVSGGWQKTGVAFGSFGLALGIGNAAFGAGWGAMTVGLTVAASPFAVGAMVGLAAYGGYQLGRSYF